MVVAAVITRRMQREVGHVVEVQVASRLTATSTELVATAAMVGAFHPPWEEMASLGAQVAEVEELAMVRGSLEEMATPITSRAAAVAAATMGAARACQVLLAAPATSLAVQPLQISLHAFRTMLKMAVGRAVVLQAARKGRLAAQRPVEAGRMAAAAAALVRVVWKAPQAAVVAAAT